MADGLHNRQQQQPVPSSGPLVLKRQRIESDDILVEILSRLPAKCLIQFRCVCKSWRALISGSHLVMKHLGRAVAGLNPNSYRLLISDSPLRSIDYKALKDFDGHVASQEFHLPAMPKSMKIVGSCNGLICLLGNKCEVLLWNPCTRDSNRLPGFSWFPLSKMFYGFGYDSTIEDYKVILGGTTVSPSGSLTTKVAVFTLKTGSWRTVQDLDYVRLNGKGCLLNGALHWLEFKWTEEQMVRPVVSSRIISFDLAKEEFQEMVPLSYIWDQKFVSARIGTTKNSLFVYIYNYSNVLGVNDTAITIWVMKEYGVKQSWSEIIRVPWELLHCPQEEYILNILNLMCILDNGEVLMNLDSSYLVLYNPKEKTFRNVLEPPVILWPEATVYVETLVSPVTGSGTDI